MFGKKKSSAPAPSSARVTTTPQPVTLWARCDGCGKSCSHTWPAGLTWGKTYQDIDIHTCGQLQTWTWHVPE